MTTTLKDTEKVRLTLAPVDAQGNTAKLDGTPTWVSSDPSVGTVVPNPDDVSAFAISTGKLGAFEVTVTGDADLGDGVVPIVATVDFEVVGDQAVELGVTVGIPEPK